MLGGGRSRAAAPLWLAVVGVVAAIALAGCTAADEDPVNSAYSSEFDRAERDASTEFERTILSDHRITSEEYAEAMGLYFSCMESRGLEVTPHDPGSGVIQFDVTGSWDEGIIESAVDECAIGTTAVIEPLYVNMLQNPDKRSLDDLTAECLVRVGVVESPFTGVDYQRESESTDFVTRVSDDPGGMRCLENPSYGDD